MLETIIQGCSKFWNPGKTWNLRNFENFINFTKPGRNAESLEKSSQKSLATMIIMLNKKINKYINLSSYN